MPHRPRCGSRGRRRATLVSAALTFGLVLGVSLAVTITLPPTTALICCGGGGGSCPTPYSLALSAVLDAKTATSAEVSYALTSSSGNPWAWANVSWGPATSYGYDPIGSIQDQFIGTWPTGDVTDTITGLQPTTTYYFVIYAFYGCQDSAGTHFYRGVTQVSWFSPMMVDWQTSLVSSTITLNQWPPPITGPPLVDCTWSTLTNLTVQGVDAENSASGPWYFSTYPIVQTSWISGSKDGTRCWADSFSGSTISLQTQSIFNSAGATIGETVTWEIQYTLSNPFGDGEYQFSVSYLENFYAYPALGQHQTNDGNAHVSIETNGAYQNPFIGGNILDVLLEVVDITASGAG
jgi:hypothetical protein